MSTRRKGSIMVHGMRGCAHYEVILRMNCWKIKILTTLPLKNVSMFWAIKSLLSNVWMIQAYPPTDGIVRVSGRRVKKSNCWKHKYVWLKVCSGKLWSWMFLRNGFQILLLWNLVDIFFITIVNIHNVPKLYFWTHRKRQSVYHLAITLEMEKKTKHPHLPSTPP